MSWPTNIYVVQMRLNDEGGGVTEDQRYFRKWARMETTLCIRAIIQSENWTHLNTNRARFWMGSAAVHAKRAASHVFKAHPELRTPEGETI